MSHEGGYSSFTSIAAWLIEQMSGRRGTGYSGVAPAATQRARSSAQAAVVAGRQCRARSAPS
jgi:hypothetical protein